GIRQIGIGDAFVVNDLGEIGAAAAGIAQSEKLLKADRSAGRNDDLMAAAGIAYDLEHGIAVAGHQHVADLEHDAAQLGPDVSGGKKLGRVARIEREEVADLLTFDVEDLQDLSFGDVNPSTVAA